MIFELQIDEPRFDKGKTSFLLRDVSQDCNVHPAAVILLVNPYEVHGDIGEIPRVQPVMVLGEGVFCVEGKIHPGTRIVLDVTDKGGAHRDGIPP